MPIIRANLSFINTLPLDGLPEFTTVWLNGQPYLDPLRLGGSVLPSINFSQDPITGTSTNLQSWSALSATAFGRTGAGTQHPRPAELKASITLASGRTIQVNTDFVMDATPDLAAQLVASGDWSAFTPPGGYALPIPVSA